MVSLNQPSNHIDFFAVPVGTFPDLESLWGPDCSDRKKARIVVALLQIGLETEDDLSFAPAGARL
jgi:hypothetical protein